MRTLDRTLCWLTVFLLLTGGAVVGGPARAQTFGLEVLREGLDPSALPGQSYIRFGDLGAPDSTGGVLFLADTRDDVTLAFASILIARFVPTGDALVVRAGDPAPGVTGSTIFFIAPFFGDGNRFGDVPVSLVLAPSFELPAYAVIGNQAELFAAVGSAAPAPATGSLVQALAGCTDDLRRLTYPALYGSGAAIVRQATPSATPEVLLLEGAPAPGTTATFDDFSTCAASESGNILFTAALVEGPSVTSAVYYRSADGLVLEPVVAIDDPAPGGGTITRLPTLDNALAITDERFAVPVSVDSEQRVLVGTFDGSGTPCCLEDLVPPGTALPGLPGTLDMSRQAALSPSGLGATLARVGASATERLVVEWLGQLRHVVSTGDPAPVFGGIGNFAELAALERGAEGEIFFTATHDIDPNDGALYVARSALGAPSLGPPALAALALGLVVAGAARLRQLRRRG